MDSQWIWILLLEFTSTMKGVISGTCLTKGIHNESMYKVCTEDTDNLIYPGKMKTIIHDLQIPRGLTSNSYIDLLTPSDQSLIISGVSIVSKDGTLSMTIGDFIPTMFTTSQGGLVRRIFEGTYHFGVVGCCASSGGSGSQITTTEALVNRTSDDISEPQVTTDSTQTTETSFPTSSDVSISTTDNPVTTTDTPVTTYEPPATTPESETRKPCTHCNMKIAVEYVIASIPDIQSNPNRTVHADFTFENFNFKMDTTLELQQLSNSTKDSFYNIDITNVNIVDVPNKEFKTIHVQAVFREPLASYKLVFDSSNPDLRVASIRILSVGKHLDGIILNTPPGQCDDDVQFCDDGPDTRIRQFPNVPNKGALDVDTAVIDDTINIELIVIAFGKVGFEYPLEIYMDVDSKIVMKTNTSCRVVPASRLPSVKVKAGTLVAGSLLPRGGTANATLYADIPIIWHGDIIFKAKSRLFAGPGGDGVKIAGARVGNAGRYWCYNKTSWKRNGDNSTTLSISSLPFGSSDIANRVTFKVIVLANPHQLMANSTHKVTVELMAEGVVNQFPFYFNISDQEIFMEIGENGRIQMDVTLREYCTSLTTSTHVNLDIITKLDTAYGHLFAELFIPSGLEGKQYRICHIGDTFQGYNIFGEFTNVTTRRQDGEIESVMIEMLPLTNIYFSTRSNNNLVGFHITVEFLDSDLQAETPPLRVGARLISNKHEVWTGKLDITKPKIEHYPDFIVLTQIAKKKATEQSNITFHYSINGTRFHQMIIQLKKGDNKFSFEMPKVIAYFHFSANKCTVVCNMIPTMQPLRDYITMAEDHNNTLLRTVPYALDEDMDTCFDLPVPGYFPPLFWLRIKDLALFRVTTKRFEVHLSGEGIKCTSVGQKSIYVGTSSKVNHDRSDMEAEIRFCKFTQHNITSTQTHCRMECECDDLQQCLNVHIIMQSANLDVWRLCELSIKDIKEQLYVNIA